MTGSGSKMRSMWNVIHFLKGEVTEASSACNWVKDQMLGRQSGKGVRGLIEWGFLRVSWPPSLPAKWSRWFRSPLDVPTTQQGVISWGEAANLWVIWASNASVMSLSSISLFVVELFPWHLHMSKSLLPYKNPLLAPYSPPATTLFSPPLELLVYTPCFHASCPMHSSYHPTGCFILLLQAS